MAEGDGRVIAIRAIMTAGTITAARDVRLLDRPPIAGVVIDNLPIMRADMASSGRLSDCAAVKE
jgi:hypothetical protein